MVFDSFIPQTTTKMKKSEIIAEITERLKNKEILKLNVSDFMIFKNARFGLWGRYLVYKQDEVYVTPFESDSVYWRANLEGLKKNELLLLKERCDKLLAQNL